MIGDLRACPGHGLSSFAVSLALLGPADFDLGP
jgi:hypothetical protein